MPPPQGAPYDLQEENGHKPLTKERYTPRDVFVLMTVLFKEDDVCSSSQRLPVHILQCRSNK